MAFTYSYSTIADSAIDPDSPIDTALMTAIRNDIVYLYEYIGGKSFTPAEPHNHNGVNSALVASIADGAISTSAKFAAGVVNQAAVGSGAIGQAQIKTGTASGSLNAVGFNSSIQLSAAGSFGFSVLSGYTDTAGSPPSSGIFWGRAAAGPWDMEITANDTRSPAAYITLSGNGNQTDYSQVYVASSRPYDMGDGEAEWFVFGEITPNGIVVQTWMAHDPPWGNNGPTDIRCDRYAHDGSGIQIVRQIIAEHGSIRGALQRGLTLEQVTDRVAMDPWTAIEVTQAMKQADMPLFPHPFVKPVDPANAIVLLDPMDARVVGRLRELHDAESALVAGMLHRGDIRIDNTALKRSGPPGVQVCAAKWKLTN